MRQARGISGIGVSASIAASVLWSVVMIYAVILKPLTGLDIVSFRLVLTLPIVAGTVAMTVAARQRLRRHLKMIRTTWWFGPALLGSTGLYFVQNFLFAWAPLNGKAVEVSLGFFLMPLVMVVVGRLVFHEVMSRWQTVAAILATIGVAISATITGGVGWPTFVVALGFPLYFTVRRLLGTDDYGGMLLELIFMFPVVTWFIYLEESERGILRNSPRHLLLVLGLGALCAAAMMTYTAASRNLSFPIFGLLSNVEPVLLLFGSLLIGETIAPIELIPYAFIWLSVLVLAGEAGMGIYQRWRRRGAL